MRNKKRTTAAAMLVTGLLTIVSGFALEGTASAHGVLDPTGKEIFLHASHHGAAWDDFDKASECRDAETPEGYPYLWHFVVKDYSAAKDALPDVIAVQTAFSGSGSVDAGHVVQSGKGWNVYTQFAGTLLDATGDSSAEGSGPSEMVLSHTCGPTQTTTTSTSTTNTGTTNTSTTNTATTNTSTTNTATTNTSTTNTSTTNTATTATSTTATETTSTAAILPTEVTRASSTVDVSGVVLTQGANTLPRTGFDPGILLMLGGMLVVSGVLMLRYSDDQATA